MCGRFYVDDETAREIEKVIRQVNDKTNGVPGGRYLSLHGSCRPDQF